MSEALIQRAAASTVASLFAAHARLEHGVAGAHIAALKALADAVDAAYGRHLTINATGAVAACLLDAGVPAGIMRGFAVIARCAGLVGHVHEEQHKSVMREIADAGERAVPYDGKVPA